MQAGLFRKGAARFMPAAYLGKHQAACSASQGDAFAWVASDSAAACRRNHSSWMRSETRHGSPTRHSEQDWLCSIRAATTDDVDMVEPPRPALIWEPWGAYRPAGGLLEWIQPTLAAAARIHCEGGEI